MSTEPTDRPKSAKKKRASQQGGSWKTLLFLILAATGMAIWNARSTRRDIEIATGPVTANQRAFFIAAASRPDIATLFKSMTTKQKVAVADNIGAHAATDPDRLYPYYSNVVQKFGLSNDAKLARLVGILLADFDPKAREALTGAMAKLAVVEPGAVAAELKNSGSFQMRAVFAALHSLGDAALPHVIYQLQDGDARPQAIAYLVETGKPAVPLLLAQLDQDNKDVRMAAVEALGKLRAREAAPILVKQYREADKGDKLQYLTALGSIGDPSTESILAGALDDESLDASMQAQAALGLGRIASPTSVARLWAILPNPDVDLTDSTIAALQLAGDRSLVQSAPLDLKLKVAAAIHSDVADGVVRMALESNDKPLRLTALRVAVKRSGAVPDVVALLRRIDRNLDGDEVDAGVTALVSTPEGLRALEPLKADPIIAAFVTRRESLAEKQS